MEMHFVQGGELLSIRVEEKKIFIKGKMSNYDWIPYRDIGEKDLDTLTKKYGEKWKKEYMEAQVLKEEMDDIEICADLKKDLQGAGWRLFKSAQ